MRETFFQTTYIKIKEAILDIDDNIIDDIYALSFWFFNAYDELHLPTIVLSFNTTSNYQENIERASDKDEAKWNFAFWLQDEILQIGGKEDVMLHKWFKSSIYYYSEEEMEKSDNEFFEELCFKGESFCKEFIALIINVIKKLNNDNIPFQKFGKHLPLIVHTLEYSDDIIMWNNQANAKAVIEEFIDWVKL